jgi:hypothetical protein
MEFRRPVAALLTALVLFGGATALTGCGDPAGRNRNDGTPDDTSQNTAGNSPSGDSQGNLPDNSDKEPGSPGNSNDGGQGSG